MGTWKLSDTAGQDGPTVTVDGMFGVRYTYLDIDLDFKRIRGASGHKDWFDPLIGAGPSSIFPNTGALALNGNVGGFGVGSISPGVRRARLGIVSACSVKKITPGPGQPVTVPLYQESIRQLPDGSNANFIVGSILIPSTFVLLPRLAPIISPKMPQLPLRA